MRITAEYVEEILGVRYAIEEMSPVDFAKAAVVPVRARLELLLDSPFVVGRVAREFGCRWAARALILDAVTDIRIWRAVWSSVQHAEGLTSAEALKQIREAALAVPASHREPAAKAACSCAIPCPWEAARIAAWYAAVARGVVADARGTFDVNQWELARGIQTAAMLTDLVPYLEEKCADAASEEEK